MKKFVLLLLLVAAFLHAETAQIVVFKENPDTGFPAISKSKGFFVEKNSNCYFIATGHAIKGSVNTQILMKDGGIKLKEEDLLGIRIAKRYEDGAKEEDWAIYKIEDKTLCKNTSDIYKSIEPGEAVWLENGVEFFYTAELKNGKKAFAIKEKRKDATGPGDSGTPVKNKDGEIIGLMVVGATHKDTNETIGIEATDIKYIFESVGVYDEDKIERNEFEALQNITGAWEGQCEVGTTFDNPFSDPMKLLSYAMMTYSAAEGGHLGEDLKGATDKVNEAFDVSATEITSDQIDASDAANTAAENGDDFFSTIGKGITYAKKINHLEDLSKFMGVDMYITDFIQLGMSVIDVDEEQVQEADKFMKAWMGDPNETDQNAQAYASCMASIGLSFPNTVSASINDEHGGSPGLNKPWDNPLRLNEQQLQILADATSPEYVDAAYRVVGQDASLYSIIAWDSLAYQQAGQVICAGTMSKAMNVQQTAMTDSLNPDGQSQGEKLGLAVARMAMQKLVPPPYNIMATMVFDIITSIGSIDGCNNMEDAVQHGSLKTMQHKNFNQCYQTRSECAEKWFWGDCMRDRHFYCCFPTIETRIAAQGVNRQLCKDDSSCGGIGIADLKKISFVPCKEGQDACADKCFPRDKYEEFFQAMTKGASRDMEGDKEGIMNQIKDMMSTEKGMCE